MTEPFPDVAPWPGGERIVDKHHNEPPLDVRIVGEFDAALDGIKGLRDRIKQLLDKSLTLPDCTDAETAGKLGDFKRMCMTAAATVNDERVRIKAPYLLATRALDAAANLARDDLSDAGTLAQFKLDAYVAEQDRLAREKAATEPAEPAAKTTKPVARGDLGARVGTKTTWLFEVQVAIRKLPAAVVEHALVAEAVGKVIGNMVRGGVREIKGVRIYSEERASVR